MNDRKGVIPFAYPLNIWQLKLDQVNLFHAAADAFVVVDDGLGIVQKLWTELRYRE